MNNPLNATDPSGFFLDKLWDEIRPFVGAIVAVGLCVWNACAGSAEAIAWGIQAGGISGAVGALANGGNVLEGAAIGAFTAMGYGVGGWLGGGLASGMVAESQGGQFLPAFAAAGVGAAFGGGDGVLGFIAASVGGGLASEVTGGKFKNGAATAAFTWALSQGAQKIKSSRENNGGEWIFPEGGSDDINDYDSVMTNGILGDRESFALAVNEAEIPGYFNPSGGALADIGESFRQKFLAGLVIHWRKAYLMGWLG